MMKKKLQPAEGLEEPPGVEHETDYREEHRDHCEREGEVRATGAIAVGEDRRHFMGKKAPRKTGRLWRPASHKLEANY
jgi:hypothetical protein